MATQCIGLRWFSVMNPFIDFVVLVHESDRERATEAIREGMDDFWDDAADGYGDCVYWALEARGIKNVMRFFDEDTETDEEWEAHVALLDKYAPVTCI